MGNSDLDLEEREVEERGYEEQWIEKRMEENNCSEWDAKLALEEYKEEESYRLENEEILKIEEEEKKFYDEWGDLEDLWEVEGKTSLDIFDEIIENVKIILQTSEQMDKHVQKNLFVMLHGHIVASIESYLSSTFIEMVLEHDKLLRKLIENDPIFSARKFTMKEFFIKQESLQKDIKQYLREIIFHKIDKVKELYKSVLNVDFGKNMAWLFNAVSLRHHCVHRAGYDKDGNEIDLTLDSIEILISQGLDLIKLIEENKNNNLSKV